MNGQKSTKIKCGTYFHATLIHSRCTFVFSFLQPNLRIVNLLLKSGADNSTRDAMGLTPVDWALMFAIKEREGWNLKPDHRQSNAIAQLLSNFSNLDPKSGLGGQPQVLLAAAGHDDAWMETVLAGGGANVNQRGDTHLEGVTPLILAVFTRKENR